MTSSPAISTAQPGAESRPAGRVLVAPCGKKVAVLAAFDPEFVEEMETVPDAYFTAVPRSARALVPVVKWWTIPAKLEPMRKLAAVVKPRGFTVDPEVSALAARLHAEARHNLAMSRAERADDFDVEALGLGLPPRPYQVAGIAYMARLGKTLNADQPGLGKTGQALAALQARDAFPAVVVCPASLKLNWEREAAMWLPGRSVRVLGESQPEVGAEDIQIINYDILAKYVEALRGAGVRGVVFDESHYLKNGKSKRAQAAKALVRGLDTRIMLTGTPILNRPEELISTLGILGRLADIGGFWHYAKRYCHAKSRFMPALDKNVWDLTGQANLAELGVKLRSYCMVRRMKADVLRELPPKQRCLVPLAMDATRTKEYAAARKDIGKWMADKAQRDPEFRKAIAHLDEEAQFALLMRRAEAAAERAEECEELVKVGALRQIAAKGKMAAVVEWARCFQESERPLLLFAHHAETIATLAGALECESITGDTPLAKRQQLVDAFQRGKIRTLILNHRAGGVGLTLTAASNVAQVELPWTPGDLEQAEDRAHRYGQTNAVTSWMLLARGTVDWDMWDMIQRKATISGTVMK